MLKNKLFTKSLLLFICASLAFSAVGCSTSNDDNVSSNTSSEGVTSGDDEIISSEEPINSDTDIDIDDTANITDDGWIYEESGDDLSADDGESVYYETVNVKNGSAPVQSDFLGFNTVYHCYTYMDDKLGRNYTEQQAQTEFNRLQNMGVKIVRTYYNEEYAYDAASGSFNWESDDMKAIYKWMQEMQKRDISIACNTGWAITAAYTKDYWCAWKGTYVDGDMDASIKNHANWMADSLKQFRAHGINNIDYLIMFTEPGGNGTVLGAENVEKLKETYIEDSYDLDPHVDIWLKATRAIHNVLVENGTRNLYKTVGPNCSRTRISADPNTRMEPLYYFAIKKASDYIDIYSSHNYMLISDLATDTVSDYVEYECMLQERIDMAHDIGKEFWYDETNLFGGGTGENNLFVNNKDYPVEALHAGSYFADSMNRGVQNLLWWYLFDQQWPDNTTTNTDGYYNGLHAWGYIPSLMHSSIPQTSYYGVSLLTKYFGNNAKVYEATADFGYFNCGVQQDKDGEWSICLSSLELDSGYVEINFEKNIGSQKFYRYVYRTNMTPTAEAELLSYDKILTTKGDRLIDKVEPNTLVVYTTVKN